MSLWGEIVFKQSHSTPWTPQTHGHNIMQTASSQALKLSLALKAPALLKSATSKVSFETQGNLLIVAPCKYKKSKLHVSNMQWHRICITILKGRRGGRGRKNGPKEDRNPEWQTLNPVTLMFYIKGLRWLCAFSFGVSNIHLLLRLVLLHARSSPEQISHSSDTTNTLGIGFILATSCNGLSGPSCRDSPNTHCLGSLETQKRGIYNPFTLASFMPLKPAPQEWYCQVRLPTQDGSTLPWTPAAAAFICCCFLEAETILGSLSWVRSITGLSLGLKEPCHLFKSRAGLSSVVLIPLTIIIIAPSSSQSSSLQTAYFVFLFVPLSLSHLRPARAWSIIIMPQIHWDTAALHSPLPKKLLQFSWAGQIILVKMSLLSKVIYRFKARSVKILTALSIELET